MSENRSHPHQLPSPHADVVGGELPVGREVDVTIGRSAADYLQVPRSEDDGIPKSAATDPVLSDFARALLERIEVAHTRVVGEASHLDSVEQIAAAYRSAERPWLRLLP